MLILQAKSPGKRSRLQQGKRKPSDEQLALPSSTQVGEVRKKGLDLA